MRQLIFSLLVLMSTIVYGQEKIEKGLRTWRYETNDN